MIPVPLCWPACAHSPFSTGLLLCIDINGTVIHKSTTTGELGYQYEIPSKKGTLTMGNMRGCAVMAITPWVIGGIIYS
jgi:hypothetical protein